MKPSSALTFHFNKVSLLGERKIMSLVGIPKKIKKKKSSNFLEPKKKKNKSHIRERKSVPHYMVSKKKNIIHKKGYSKFLDLF